MTKSVPTAGVLPKGAARRRFAPLLAVTLGVLILPRPAQAVVTIVAREVVNGASPSGFDVVFSWGGGSQSLNVSPLPLAGGNLPVNPELDPAAASFASGPGTGDVYFGVSNLSPFGTGSLSAPTSRTGSILASTFGVIVVPVAYASGAPYPAGSMTFSDTTLSGLGVGSLTPSITIATWGNGPNADSIVMSIPEPSLAMLLLLGLAPLALRRRRSLSIWIDSKNRE